MEKIKIILTDHLNVKKTVEFSSDQVKAISKLKDYARRLEMMADHYSSNYWVDVIIDGKKFYSVQWAEL